MFILQSNLIYFNWFVSVYLFVYTENSNELSGTNKFIKQYLKGANSNGLKLSFANFILDIIRSLAVPRHPYPYLDILTRT